MLKPIFVLLAACLVGLVACDDDLDWWQLAVVYQIYPRSFKDSDGDGIGDLRGIIEKVPYLKELGVSAVWLSPIYPSPGKDFGYDISDYQSIDPTFGTMDDFDQLVSKLHEAGIKLIMDYVPNHTSNQHQWFKQSLNKSSPFSDYYIWKDGNKYPDGTITPPNNWVSCFDGSAWEYDNTRKQFYFHQFLKEQPDLNYGNPDVLMDMMNVLSYWLDRGVDGFRMDAVGVLSEDPELRNESYVCSNHSYYGCLNHEYTTDQDGTYNVLLEFRNRLDTYKLRDNVTRLMIVESYSKDWSKLMEYYKFDGKPVSHFPFNFRLINHMTKESTGQEWENEIMAWYKNASTEWANWVMGNHDQHRVATRLGKETVDGVNMMMLLLKGTAVTYNGDELGMENSFVRWDQAKDPQGIRAGPDGFKNTSRDPQRGPFLWNATTNAGFTNGTPWLPAHTSYWQNNVEMQQKSNVSHLSTYKRMVKLRQTYLWRNGENEVLAIKPNVLGIIRSLINNPTIVALLNVGSEESVIDLPLFRETFPPQLYVYAQSNVIKEDLTMKAINSSCITLPPKAGMVLSTQPLDAPIEINSTTLIRPSSFLSD